jgi:hypothetical protein
MFNWPEVPPPTMNVVIVLDNGDEFIAELVDGQWWAPLPDNPNAAPIANAYVVGWRFTE